MEFKDEYVLESGEDFPEYDVVVHIESDYHDQLFICVDTRGSIASGHAAVGNLDNDAIDGIIALLERARQEMNN